MALDLVTLAEYKAYMGILGNTQDAEIKSLIPKASALVKSLCRRTFVDYYDDPKVQQFRGSASSLLLAESPLVSVSSVEFSADYGNTFVDLVEFTDYVVNHENCSVDIIASGYATPGKPSYLYKVTYNAGFETVPEDLKTCVLDVVKYLQRNDSAVHSNKAVGTNTMQIEYLLNAQMPAHIQRIILLYSDNYA